MGSHLEGYPRPRDIVAAVSKAGIEKPGVMDSEFAQGGIVGDHFRGVGGRDADFLLRAQDIEVAWIEYDALGVDLGYRLPKVQGLIEAGLIEVDNGRVFLGPVADKA